MAMLLLNGTVANVFDTPASTDKKTGVARPASTRVQIHAENILENGQKRMELVTLKVDDGEALKEYKSPHLADFISLALNTGCRKNELLKLSWDRVDLAAGHFRLEGEHTKNGKRRIIPLSDVARAALLGRANFRDEHCLKSPWVFCHKNGDRVQYMQRGFAAACRRAGIEDFHVHDLRHTCASWLVSAGVPLIEIKVLLGHSSIEMTERYAHLAPENLGRVTTVLNRLQSVVSSTEE